MIDVTFQIQHRSIEVIMRLRGQLGKEAHCYYDSRYNTDKGLHKQTPKNFCKINK